MGDNGREGERESEQISRRSSRLSQGSGGTAAVLEQLEQMIVSDEWVGRGSEHSITHTG